MKKLTSILIVFSLLVALTWLWPLSHASTRSIQSQGPVMKAHIIDMGQANATLLEFPCGAVLIDAGAQDEEKVDELVRFLNEFFTRRLDLNRTLKSIIITHNHIDHTRALRKVVEMQGLTVERYIDHGMLEGTGTGNPNWVRDALECGDLSPLLFFGRLVALQGPPTSRRKEKRRQVAALQSGRQGLGPGWIWKTWRSSDWWTATATARRSTWTCTRSGITELKKGSGSICAQHPPGRSGKLNPTPFSIHGSRKGRPKKCATP